jgi:hypothetical protein
MQKHGHQLTRILAISKENGSVEIQKIFSPLLWFFRILTLSSFESLSLALQKKTWTLLSKKIVQRNMEQQRSHDGTPA